MLLSSGNQGDIGGNVPYQEQRSSGDLTCHVGVESYTTVSDEASEDHRSVPVCNIQHSARTRGCAPGVIRSSRVNRLLTLCSATFSTDAPHNANNALIGPLPRRTL